MCGKFTQMSSWHEVHAFSQPLILKKPDDQIVVATPMRFANIMRLNARGERELVAMRWGFAGKSDLAPTRPRHMHARSETIDTLPTFSQAFANARGILLVETFNEGEDLPNGKTKQWVISPDDKEPIAIAVICERWTNGAESLETFVQDHAGQRTHIPDHGPDAGNPSARVLGGVARRDGCKSCGHQGAAHDL